MVVVTGYASQQISQALGDLPVDILENRDWQTGQSSSVAAAALFLPPDTGSAVFLLSDQPLIPVELVRGLVALHAETLAPIVVPLVDGKRANPVPFDRQLFPELSRLTGDSGGRVLFSRYPITWLTWHGAAYTLDVDTVQDYQRLLAM